MIVTRAAQLRRFGLLISGSGFPIEDQDLKGEALPFFKVADISAASGDGRLRAPASSISRETATRLRAAVLPEGATVLPKIGAALLGNRRAMTTMPSCIDNNVLALVPSAAIFPRFAYYVMMIVDAAEFALPGPVPSLDVGALLRRQLLVPPLTVQHKIADYLDRETARIDALIAAKRRMVELLADRWHQHLILSLRLSGEIAPVGPRLRSLAQVALGRQRTPGQNDGPHMVRYLRAANVKDGQLDLDDVKEMNFAPAEQSTFALRSGDILITEGAGSLAAVGATAIYRGEFGGVVCFQNTLIRMRPRPHVSAEYLLWWCRAAYHAGLFAGIAGGANIFHVSAERIKGLRGRFPERKEQKLIAARVRKEETGYLSLRDALNAQLDLLHERRQALITAAVTRQLDIPEAA